MKTKNIIEIIEGDSFLKKELDTFFMIKDESRIEKIFNKLQLEIFNPGGRDPITRYILSLNGKKILLACFFPCLIVFFVILISIFENNFSNIRLKIDTLHDLGFWNQFFVWTPLLIILIKIYFETI